MNQIELFLLELRGSADIILNVFSEGSCFKLFEILRTIFPESLPYWSDRDSHCITKIGENYYDIGGKVNLKYIENQGYYLIPKNQYNGYTLLKYVSENKATSVKIEKYVINE